MVDLHYIYSMKKLSILIFIFTNWSNFNAQSYIPMVEDSMIVVNGIWGYDFAEPVVYKYLGDTTINSTSYFRVYHCSLLEDSSFALSTNTNYYGAIREVNKKVYFLHKDSSIERKIYDFSLSLNDTTSIFFTTMWNSENVNVKFKRIDTVSNYYGRDIWIHDVNSSVFFPNYHIVEGFGNVDFCANEIETDYRTIKLCSIKKNNPSHNIPVSYSACYWQIKNSFISLSEIESNSVEVYPNPAINQITVQSNDTDLQSVSIYDVNGKFINQISVQKNKEVIDLKFMKSGIYTLKIVTKKGIVTKKIVKQ